MTNREGVGSVFALIPACFALAGLFIRLQQRNRQVPALVLKGLASLCFVALGCLCSPGTGAARLIVCGLALGCAADVLLGLRSVFRKRRQLFFLAGGIVFLCGHILYLLSAWPPLRCKAACLAAAVPLACLLLKLLYARITVKKQLRYFGAVYFGVLVLLVCAAFGGAVTARSAFTLLFACGTLLFLCSDVLLNLYSFGPKLPFGFRVLYSGLYYAGQLLIALSLYTM